MKYILLMSSTSQGVNSYQAWSERDRNAHMEVLKAVIKDLSETGEFVATQPLTGPAMAKVVRGVKDGLPVTDGVFPESKEFLLGYWIVDVTSPERACEIAGRISAAPGPAGVPTNMPIELRQFASAGWNQRALRPQRSPSHSVVRPKSQGANMKYILMMNTMRAGHGVPTWPKGDLQTHIAFMMDLNKELHAAGELVSAEGLSFPDQARQVVAGKDGKPITDGVFPESKEFLAGFWILDVDSPERAYAIAARISAAPGPGGAPLNMPIEVRPIMSAPPPEMM